jgi:hypothetical protein
MPAGIAEGSHPRPDQIRRLGAFSSKLSITDGDMAVEVVNDYPRVDPL